MATTEQNIDSFLHFPLVTWSFFWLPVVIFVIALAKLPRRHPRIDWVPPVIFAFAALYFCGLVQLCWLLRMPIGPVNDFDPMAGPAGSAERVRQFLAIVRRLSLHSVLIDLAGVLVFVGAARLGTSLDWDEKDWN